MRRGLTMLEVLIAAMLLAIGLLGALEVVAHSSVTSARARDRARGLVFARSKIEEILKEPVLQTGTDSGQGVDETADYDWEATIEPSQHASLVVVTVRATNRVTGQFETISVLRRPDLDTAPDPTGAATGGTTGAAGGTL